MGLLLKAAVRLRGVRDERGQGLTEYALLLVGIVALVGVALLALQEGILDAFAGIFGGD